jgi:hypothetical protein
MGDVQFGNRTVSISSSALGQIWQPWTKARPYFRHGVYSDVALVEVLNISGKGLAGVGFMGSSATSSARFRCRVVVDGVELFDIDNASLASASNWGMRCYGSGRADGTTYGAIDNWGVVLNSEVPLTIGFSSSLVVEFSSPAAATVRYGLVVLEF